VVRDEGSSTGWKVEVGPFGVGGFTELVRALSAPRIRVYSVRGSIK
jgi:hypothetical protein